MYLGIDIGGTKTLVATFTSRGVLQDQYKFPTPQRYTDFIKELAKAVANLSTNEFVVAGVAVPGRIERATGTVVDCGNLPWQEVSIKKDIERFTRCPVVVDNDANLAGLSEAVLLQNKYDKVLYITISTGIGTGIIIDQVIDPDFEDTEGGHIVLEHQGKLQRWEKFASGNAIVHRFGKRAQDIHDAKTWKIIARDISIGMIDLIAVVQPDVIVLGGGVSTYFSRFEKYLLANLEQYDTPLTPIPPIRIATRPNEAVVYGCFELAKSYARSRRKATV